MKKNLDHNEEKNQKTGNVALIPARGGSKGIPKKNLKPICGKPLIAWSILQAKASKMIDEVYVSTDCPEIAAVAEHFGAKIPFLRPARIATDEASTESAMLHFSDWASSENLIIKNLVLLQATSPIRARDRLDKALGEFSARQFDSMLSVSESHRFFWKKYACGALKSLDYEISQRPRRQDLHQNQINWMETGSFYISGFSAFRKHRNRLFGKVGFHVTPYNESFEIDDKIDFLICQSLMENIDDFN